MEPKEQKIVDAAIRLVRRHGYRKVTMSDIAEASGMSRPTLYAAFPNKEAVFAALAAHHAEQNEAATHERLGQAETLVARLACIFEVWIIGPFESAVDAPEGPHPLRSAEAYAPAAIGDSYARLEQHLVSVLKDELPRRRGMTARDLAHILMLATKGLTTSATDVTELRRLIEGLITMTVATTKLES